MRLILDRIEKNRNGKRIAVFECADVFFNINEDCMPKDFIDKLKTGHILEAEIENETLVNPKILYDETEKENNKMKNRLNNLFNRNK